MRRILTLSSLFPDATRPNFGVFVEQQTLSLAAHPEIDLQVVAPVGVPPWQLNRHPRYRALARLPVREDWKTLSVSRPRFLNLPGSGGRFHARALEHALVPVLERIRRDFPFDLIAAEFFYPDGVAAVALGRRFGVPVSIKARGADIHEWGRKPATASAIKRAGRAADGLLAVSQAMRGDMVALGIPGNRIEPSYTGVDFARFASRDRAAAKAACDVHGPLVVSVGALIPRKGHDIAIDAVAGLPGVSLWIVGDGPDRAPLEARIARLGLASRVRLTGPIAHAHLPEVLAAADVMALASSSEGLANAWVEALASGTPIVIPDVGGARELLPAPARAGRIVQRTPEAFAAAISALLADPPPSDVIRAAAGRFTWSANTAHLIDFYGRLIDSHRMARRD